MQAKIVEKGFVGITASIRHLKRRTILRSSLAMIINPRRSDVGMAEPFLYLSNISLMIQRISGSGSTQRMRPNLKT